jgi:uncharacterized protein
MTAGAAIRLSGLLVAVLAASAADFAALKPQGGYVSDFARVLDSGTRAQLESYLSRVEQATKAQVAIVTIDSLEGEPIEDVADLLFRKWGIGQKGENNGALFLLSIKDRRSRLELGYGLEPILPDGLAGQILREMRPALRQGDYRTALSTAAAELGTRIAQAKGVTLEGAPPLRRARRETEVPFGGFLFLILIIVALAIMGAGRGGRGRRGPPGGSNVGSMMTGMILGQMLGGGRNRGWGRGSGGFGGFDSGGGFGGFGGGDSGGGGASSSW